MNVSKKILALVLALVMAISCFSVCAFAYSPFADTGTLLWFSDDTADDVDEYIESISSVNAANYTTLKIYNIPGVNFSAALQKFTGLTKIEFVNCDIIDISWLSSGTNLSTINLSNNLIYDLSIFSSIQTVPTLNLSNNLITNVAPLLNSSSVKYLHLNLDNNFVSDVRPLNKCFFATGSVRLHLSGNYAKDSISDLNVSHYGSADDQHNNVSNPFLALFQNNTFKIIGYFGSINNKEAVIGTTVQVFDTQSRTISEVNISQLEQQNQQTYILRIEKNAFKNNVSVEGWVIGNKVSFIDGYAFSRCTNMKRIKLGTGITTIKSFTFYYCLNLLGICIPDNVTTVEARAFDYCMRLKYVEFSNGNTSVHANTFSRCNEEYLTVYASSDINNWSSSTLKSSLDNLLINPAIDRNYEFKDGEMTDVVLTSTVLRVPAGIDRIDFGVQNNNTTYTVFTFIMPEGITFASIDLFAPSNTPVEILVPSTLSDLSGIDYPAGTNVTAYTYGDTSLTDDNSYAVNGDYKIAYDVLEKYLNEPEYDIEIVVPSFDFDIIGVRAFYGIGTDNAYNELGEHITAITLPNGIVEIKSSAFRRLRVIESITFGSDNRLKKIGDGAFGYDYALSSISIPQSVTTIGAEAFEVCTNLESISFGGVNSQLSVIGEEIFRNCTKLRNNNPDAEVNDGDYRFFKIPDSVNSIPLHAFSYINGANKFTTIELPNHVNTFNDFDENSFEGTDIRNVTIIVYCDYYSDFYYELLSMGFGNVICCGLPNNNLNSNPERISQSNITDENETAVFALNTYVNDVIDDCLKACENGSFDIELLNYEIAFILSTNKEIQ